MGAGGGPAVGRRFCNYAARRTAAKIRHRMMRLGGLTYIAVSAKEEGVLVNTLVTTREDIQFIHSETIPPGELRDLELYELPLRSETGVAIRDNRDQRSRLAGTLAQARFSHSVNSRLSEWEVNRTHTSRFGNVLRVRAYWSKMIDVDLLQLASASNYRQQLKMLLQSPDLAVTDAVQRIEVELEPQGAVLPSVAQMMQVARQRHTVQSPLLDDLVAAEAQVFQPTVQVYRSQAPSGALHNILRPLERPASLAEFRACRRHLRGLLAHLERDQEAAQKEAIARTREFELKRQGLKQTIRRLRSLWYHLDVMVYTPAKFMRWLQTQFEAYHNAHARYSEAVARLESLSASAAQVSQTLADYEMQWLTRIEQGLEAVMGRRTVKLDTVVFAPLEPVYSALIDATLRARIEMNNRHEAKARTSCSLFCWARWRK
jgi:hypothetical protein